MTTLFVIVGLLVLAGFLAGSESALSSITRVVVEEMVEHNPRKSRRIEQVLKEPARYFNVLLLVRKACELTAAILLAEWIIPKFASHTTGMLIAILVMVVISYVVVGVGPRTLGRQHAISWARPGAAVATRLAAILGPITTLLIALGNAITPGRGFKSGPFTNEAELRDLVDQASERGLVEESEREMIHSVFDLGETLVRELMVPRTDMVWVESGKNLRQALSLALRSGFSRVPVISENLDHIIGIVYMKDLALRIHEHREAETTEKVEQLVRPATFVPETKVAAELLKEMQKNQIHLAIVVDEYGGTAGIITIEDILEEIVGEIADEFDDVEQEVEWLGENRARISARLHVEDFASEFDVDVDHIEREDVDTVGGLMGKELGRVPIPGSTIEIAPWRITAERHVGRRHRIGTLLVERVIPGEGKNKSELEQASGDDLTQ